MITCDLCDVSVSQSGQRILFINYESFHETGTRLEIKSIFGFEDVWFRITLHWIKSGHTQFRSTLFFERLFLEMAADDEFTKICTSSLSSPTTTLYIPTRPSQVALFSYHAWTIFKSSTRKNYFLAALPFFDVPRYLRCDLGIMGLNHERCLISCNLYLESYLLSIWWCLFVIV